MFTRLPILGVLLILVVTLTTFTLFDGLPWLIESEADVLILTHIRLPLVTTAILVGAALAVSSACLQVTLRNPLADPSIIGITSGASLCAAILLLAGQDALVTSGPYLLPLACFAGAVASTLVIYHIAKRMSGVNSAVILAGIALSTVTGAIVAWLHLISDAQSMRNLTFWLMGSLHQADWLVISVAGPIMALLLTFLLTQGRRLNWFYFGTGDAQLMGVDVVRFNKQILIASALLVGAAVSIAGSIAFVGLLVPHLLRNIFGFDNRFIIPASALVGAVLMLLIAMLNTQLVGGIIPVSMLTSTIGGPLFLYSVMRLFRAQG